MSTSSPTPTCPLNSLAKFYCPHYLLLIPHFLVSPLDVASMLAAVPGNKKAIGQMYNICSDRAITFTGITKAVGKALGKVRDLHPCEGVWPGGVG